MKIRLGTLAVVAGTTLVLGPWLLIPDPSLWWFLISVVGLLIAPVAGMGAQMEQLRQGNTGEELLRSVWSLVKERSAKDGDRK